MKDAFRLSDLLIQLRRDLQAVRAADPAADLKFELGEVELELQIVAEKQAGANAEAGWWILKAGASANNADTATQTLKLKLKPVDGRTNTPARIGGIGRLPNPSAETDVDGQE